MASSDHYWGCYFAPRIVILAATANVQSLTLSENQLLLRSVQAAQWYSACGKVYIKKIENREKKKDSCTIR